MKRQYVRINSLFVFIFFSCKPLEYVRRLLNEINYANQLHCDNYIFLYSDYITISWPKSVVYASGKLTITMMSSVFHLNFSPAIAQKIWALELLKNKELWSLFAEIRPLIKILLSMTDFFYENVIFYIPCLHYSIRDSL